MTRLVMIASLVLLTVLAQLVPVVSGTGVAPAAAASGYDARIDLTFPVAGSPATFIDDYEQCRGGAGCPRIHRATDIMAPYGARIHAAMGGTVRFITGVDAPPPSYGYMLTIRGDDGRDYSYIHLGAQDRGPEEAYARGIARGVRVERGQHIGFNGHSGNASASAPHLHFEIEDRSIVDPHGSQRMNPYRSLAAARDRGDVAGTVRPMAAPTPAGPAIEVPSGARRFADVRMDHTHAENIGWLAQRGITLGCNPPTNDRFCPDAPVTRQQMAAFLVRAQQLPPGDGRGFVDVDSWSTFADDISRLATAGVTVGCNPPTNDRFCPGDLVSRMQTASFLHRSFDLPEGTVTFTDVDRRSAHARGIAGLHAANVTRGCNPPTNDRFCPTRDVTRGQFASFLRRAVDHVER